MLVALSSAGGVLLALAAQGFGRPELGRLLLAILVHAFGAPLSMGLQLLAAGFYRQRAGPVSEVFR